MPLPVVKMKFQDIKKVSLQTSSVTGKPHEDGCTLSDYKIQKESVLHLGNKLRDIHRESCS
jgi:hypothetical protein